MKKILNSAMWGISGGLTYAFISFYLITPLFRNKMITIALFGLQGLILGIMYTFLKLMADKYIKKASNTLIMNMMIGGVSGLLASSYNVFIRAYSALFKVKGVISTDYKIEVISQLAHYSIGIASIGLVIGFLIGLNEKNIFKQSTK